MFRHSCLAITIFSIVTFTITGCGGNDTTGNATGPTNSAYHVNYSEWNGNSEQPVTNGREKSITVWLEVDSPNASTGRVWVEDIYLERSDRPGVNLVANPSFESGLWLHHENTMCLASDTWCRNIVEFDNPSIWSLDASTFLSGHASAVANIAPLGQGYQTHIYAYPLLDITGIPAGVTFKASAYLKIENNLQARLGLDFREADVNPANTRENIRAVNGTILRGSTNSNWVKLSLR